MELYGHLNYEEEEIRLLRIDVSEAQQHELISNVALRYKRQQYVALSYTWGDQTQKTAISVNGQGFPVSVNLHEALHQVREYWKRTHGVDGKPLLLWCDQICINQSSNNEKNHQVAYMSQIYKRAELVLVSLPVPSSVGAGFSSWSEWKEWHTKQAKATDLTSEYMSPDPMEYTYSEKPKDSPIAAWDNIKAIVNSTWWSRAWVYQEFMLASRTTFLIAGLAAPWVELNDVLSSFFANVDAHQVALSSAIADIDEQVQRLDMEATDQWQQRARLDKELAEYHSGCGAQCRAWHASSKEHLQTSCDPCRKQSLFGQCYENTFGEKGENDPDEACATAFCATLFSHILLPIACLEYLLVATAVPIWYVGTLGPWSVNKEKKYETQQAQLHAQANEKQERATQMKQKAQQTLIPHETQLVQTVQSWSIVRSILQSKNEIAGNAFAPLSRLMKHSRNCHCQDPRDKIFAFLGLADPAYGLVADYGPANTLHNVVTAATRAVILTERSLAILHDAKEDNAISHAADHLPSWVPNYSLPDARNVEYQRFLAGIQLPPAAGLAASGRRQPVVSFRADRNGNPDRVLQARGVRVCRLTGILRDVESEPWRRFAGERGIEVATRNTAMIGDEVWVLFGCAVPFVLSSLSSGPSSSSSRQGDADNYYQILAQAMLWENDQPSPILHGAVINGLADGAFTEEDVSLI